MSNKRRPKKRSNAAARYNRAAAYELKDLVMVFVGGVDGLNRVFNYQTGIEVKAVTQRMFDAILEAQHLWVVQIAAFFRDQNGDEYFSAAEISAPHRCKHDQMVTGLEKEHNELIKGSNPLHLINVGYIASPRQIEFNPSRSNEIYSKLGAYEPISKWEYEKGVKK